MEDETKIYLGVDWGEKRIGLALADNEIKLATPFKTVGNLEELSQVIKEEVIDVMVLGKPIKMRGVQEGVSPVFLDFADKLQKKFPEIKIEMIDERLSSKAADALPGGNLKASRDEVAAMIILQQYLDNNAE
jgi:putative holliday junction resolvase